MSNHNRGPLAGEILEEEVVVTLAELCRSCGVHAESVLELVEQGIAEPLDSEPARWRFTGVSIRRVQCALRLRRDLGVNYAGAAVVLDLLEEVRTLRERLNRTPL